MNTILLKRVSTFVRRLVVSMRLYRLIRRLQVLSLVQVISHLLASLLLKRKARLMEKLNNKRSPNLQQQQLPQRRWHNLLRKKKMIEGNQLQVCLHP